MSKNGKIVLGLIIIGFSVIMSLLILNIVEKAQPYRLTLSSEGCAFAQSLALSVERTDGVCSTIVAYAPFAFGSGGRIFLNDGNTIEVTSNMVLATAETDTKLPPTPSQRFGMRWVYGWLLLAVASAFYIIYIKRFSKK